MYADNSAFSLRGYPYTVHDPRDVAGRDHGGVEMTEGRPAHPDRPALPPRGDARAKLAARQTADRHQGVGERLPSKDFHARAVDTVVSPSALERIKTIS